MSLPCPATYAGNVNGTPPGARLRRSTAGSKRAVSSGSALPLSAAPDRNVQVEATFVDSGHQLAVWLASATRRYEAASAGTGKDADIGEASVPTSVPLR